MKEKDREKKMKKKMDTYKAIGAVQTFRKRRKKQQRNGNLRSENDHLE